MKMRRWAVVMIIFVMIFAVGCGTQETDGDGTPPAENTIEPNADTVVEEAPQTETPEEALEDEALLSSLSIITPMNISYETETVFNMEGESMRTVTKIYMSEGNMRYETALNGMTAVIVYDENNELIYSWDTDSQEGFIFSAEDDMMAGMVEMAPTTDYANEDSNEDGIVNGLDYLGYGDMLTAANLTEWEGHKAVYFDMVVDDGIGNKSRMEMWLSTEYGIPLKSVYYDPSGEVSLEMTVRGLSDDPIDPAMFMPPDDVSFMDMSEMMN